MEVEVWIFSRGPRQSESAAAAFARVAHEPRRYGLERVEGVRWADGAMVGRVFVGDKRSSNLPGAAVWRALKELGSERAPIGQQQIVCFPLH